jgi:tartrate dehydratase beta subunit/fumarate hydratase class I family protein
MKGVKVFGEYPEDLENEVTYWLNSCETKNDFQVLSITQTTSLLGKTILTVFYTWN